MLLNYHIGCIVLGLLYFWSQGAVRLGCYRWSNASACNTDTIQNQHHQISNTQRTENTTTDVVIQQQSRKLLMIDTLTSETCWAHKMWNKIASDIKLVFCSSILTMLHGPINIKLLDQFECLPRRWPMVRFEHSSQLSKCIKGGKCISYLSKFKLKNENYATLAFANQTTVTNTHSRNLPAIYRGTT